MPVEVGNLRQRQDACLDRGYAPRETVATHLHSQRRAAGYDNVRLGAIDE